MIHYRENWNGPVLSAAMALPVGKKRAILPPLAPLKTDVVPIAKKKFNDLQVLQTFCLSQEAQENYKSLRHSGHAVAPVAPRAGKSGYDPDNSVIDDEEEDESWTFR